jgi:hypothetical protein
LFFGLTFTLNSDGKIALYKSLDAADSFVPNPALTILNFAFPGFILAKTKM